MTLRPLTGLLAPILLWAQAPAPPADAEVLLLQPILANTPLGDGLSAYPGPKGETWVPLGELCRLFGFGIRVDPSGRVASGFFIAPKRRFRLDLLKRVVEVEGQILPLATEEAFSLGGDIFVDSRLLPIWFPLKATVDRRGASLVIEPKEKFPVQLMWEQERALKGFGAGSAGPGAALALPTQATPYGFLDWPMIDWSSAWTTSQHSATAPVQGSMIMTGDALWMTGQLAFTRDFNARNRLARATLFREDPDGEILGPVGARRVYLGYVQQNPSLELAGAIPAGRGFLVDNYPTAYRTTFANRTFRGNLPDGWYAELFQNGALVSMVRSRPDGLYEFPNIPMRFGLNIFKLVFHGPLGERREEIHRLDIAQDMPEAGHVYYRVASLKPTDDLASTAQLKTSSSLETEFGLTNTLAIKGALARLSLPEGYHTYQVVGMRSAFSFLALESYLGQDRSPDRPGSPGSAMQWVARTGVGYSTFSLSRTDYRNGFVRASSGGSGGASGVYRSQTSMDLSHAFTVHAIPFTVFLTHSQQEMVSAGKLTQDNLQLSANLPSFNLTQTFQRSASDAQNGTPIPIDANLTAFFNSDNYYRQVELGYSITQGRFRFQRWGLGQDYQAGDGTLYRVNIKGPDTRLRNTTLTASLNKLIGRLSYGMDLQYSRNEGYVFGLRLGASFGREPRSGRWACSATTIGYQGGLSGQAYVDTNGNGRKDPGERVLSEPRFDAGSGVSENLSRDPQTAFYLNLGRAQKQDIRLETTSLDDPSHVPAKPAIRIVPRPGKVVQIDYPVAVLGEITSTTRLRSHGKVEPYGGVEVELLDGAGKRVKGVRSAFDGFLEFRDLPMGPYTLQLTSEEVQRLNLKERPSRRILLEMAKPFQDGMDLILIDPASSETPSVPSPKEPPVPAPTTLPPTSPSSPQPSTPLPASMP